MGKKNKETHVGRRRPMIQLGSNQKQGKSNNNNSSLKIGLAGN